MVEQRQSAMQRIQVGLVGLVIVLLFVSLANMVLDQASKGQQPDGDAGGVAGTAASNSTPDEPLAELGVTPVAKDEETSKALDASGRNIQPPVRRQ
jgi:uncharacterized membrane protein